MIALIEKDDGEVVQAKSNLYTQQDGNWVIDESIAHRQMSNNTILYKHKPTREELHKHIKTMEQSGEPKQKSGLYKLFELLKNLTA